MSIFSVWLGFLLLFKHIVPIRRCLVIYHGIVGYAAGFVSSTWIYIRTDGPHDSAKVFWIASRDSAISYGLSAYSLTHRSLFLRLAKWILFKVALPILCITAALYVLRERLPLTRLYVWVVQHLITKIMPAWEYVFWIVPFI